MYLPCPAVEAARTRSIIIIIIIIIISGTTAL
jgi:hypothetical protein